MPQGFGAVSRITLLGAPLGVLGALIAAPVTATIQLLGREITRARPQVAVERTAPARHASPYRRERRNGPSTGR